jgi:hypothetical protein
MIRFMQLRDYAKAVIINFILLLLKLGIVSIKKKLIMEKDYVKIVI